VDRESVRRVVEVSDRRVPTVTMLDDCCRIALQKLASA